MIENGLPLPEELSQALLRGTSIGDARPSDLSLLGLNELEASYASYGDLADVIRQLFSDPKQDLFELYQRLIFNILIGNTECSV